MSEDGGDERPTLDEVRGHLSVLRAAMDNALPGAEHRRAREEADRLQVVLDALDERTRKLTLESCKRLVADNEIARLRAASDDSCGTSNGTSPCGPCGVCRECLRDSARSAQARADAMQQRAEKAERALAEARSQLAASAMLRGQTEELHKLAEADLASASSQLAALHAACVVLDNGRYICRICRRSAFPGEPLGHEPTCALADLATAAREHEAMVRADERQKALNEAADRIESTPPTLLASASDWQRWLREMAAEAEVKR